MLTIDLLQLTAHGSKGLSGRVEPGRHPTFALPFRAQAYLNTHAVTTKVTSVLITLPNAGVLGKSEATSAPKNWALNSLMIDRLTPNRTIPYHSPAQSKPLI